MLTNYTGAQFVVLTRLMPFCLMVSKPEVEAALKDTNVHLEAAVAKLMALEDLWRAIRALVLLFSAYAVGSENIKSMQAAGVYLNQLWAAHLGMIEDS